MACTASHTCNTGNRRPVSITNQNGCAAIQDTIVAQLLAIVMAPGKGIAVVTVAKVLISNGQGMIPTRRNINNRTKPTGAGIFHQLKFALHGLHRHSAVFDPLIAQLTTIVPTPTPDGTILQKRHGEAIAGNNFFHMVDLAKALTILDRQGRIVHSGIVLTQLAMLIMTRCIDNRFFQTVLGGFFHQEQSMISTGSHCGNAGKNLLLLIDDLDYRGCTITGLTIGVYSPGMVTNSTDPNLEFPLLRLISQIRIGCVIIDLDRRNDHGCTILDHGAVAAMLAMHRIAVFIIFLTAFTHKGVRRSHIPFQTAEMAMPNAIIYPNRCHRHLDLKHISGTGAANGKLFHRNDRLISALCIRDNFHMSFRLFTGGHIIGNIVARVPGISLGIILTIIVITNEHIQLIPDLLRGNSRLFLINGLLLIAYHLPIFIQNGAIQVIFHLLFLLIANNGRSIRVIDRIIKIIHHHRIVKVIHFMLLANGVVIPCRLIPFLSLKCTRMNIAITIPVGAIFRLISVYSVLVHHFLRGRCHTFQFAKEPSISLLGQKQSKGIPGSYIHNISKSRAVTMAYLNRVIPGKECTIAKLTICIIAPCPDSTICPKGHSMILSHRDLRHHTIIAQNRDGNSSSNACARTDSQNLCCSISAAEDKHIVLAILLLQNIRIHHMETQIAQNNSLRSNMLVKVKAFIDVKSCGIFQQNGKLLVFIHFDQLIQCSFCPSSGIQRREIAVKFQRIEAFLAHSNRNIAVCIGVVTQLAKVITTSCVDIAIIDTESHMVAAHVKRPGDLHIVTVIAVSSTCAIYRCCQSIFALGHHNGRIGLLIILRNIFFFIGASLANHIITPGHQGHIPVIYRTGSLHQSSVSASRHMGSAIGHHKNRHTTHRTATANLALIISAETINGAVMLLICRSGHDNSVTIASSNAHDTIHNYTHRRSPVGQRTVRTQLLILIITPRPNITVGPDSVSSSTTSRNRHNIGHLAAKAAGAIAFHHCAGIGGEGIIRLALSQLAIVIPTPGIDPAASSQSQREVFTCRNRDNGVLYIFQSLFSKLLHKAIAQIGILIQQDHTRIGITPGLCHAIAVYICRGPSQFTLHDLIFIICFRSNNAIFISLPIDIITPRPNMAIVPE